MKQIIFSEVQKDLLQILLKQRLKSFEKELDLEKKENRRFQNDYVKPLVSVLDKINTYEQNSYTDKEKTSIISCVNEHYDDYRAELHLSTIPSSWVTVSDNQREVIEKLDNCLDILYKCGYYQRKNEDIDETKFRYGNFLLVIDKMKMSDNMVFLSFTGKNDIYKIAFTYNKEEYLPIEMKDKITRDSLHFIPMNGESPDIFGRKQFKMVTTKLKAKEFITTCNKQYYKEGIIDFINTFLE